MTISFSNFDSFEKPKTAATESAGAEYKAGDFAAFFNVSAFVAPVNVSAKFAAPESSDEVTVANQPIESNSNFFKTDDQIAPVFLPNTSGSRKKEEILDGDSAVKKDAGFQTSAKSQNIAGGEIPTTPPREPAPLNAENSLTQKLIAPKLVQEKTLDDAPKLFNENSNIAVTDVAEPIDAEKITVVAQLTASNPSPFKKDSQTEPVVLQNGAVQKVNLNLPVGEKSVDANFTKSNLITENQPAILRREVAPPLSEKNFPARLQVVNAEINRLSVEFSREKNLSNAPNLFGEVSAVFKAGNFKQANSALDFVVGRKISEQIEPAVFAENSQGFSARTSPENAEVNQFSPEFNQFKKSSAAPKLFADVSTVVKADDSVKTNLAPDFVTGEKIVAPIRQIVSGENGQSLNQPESESTKVERQFEVQANPGGQIFNNLLNSVAKEPNFIETATPISNLSGKVFEQVEPRIFELAAAMQGSEEKRILKMRLNPAELGAVEITLEKNAAGVINAHFQTQSETTRQVLNESLSQLRNSLENSGWQVGSLEISCDSSSSNGGEQRENQSEQFGTSENQFVGTGSFDENSNTEDDRNRLVSLRA